ncbi:MADS-box transcription factor 51-like [Macadamia integrifolia]|uniref:MADS-box transcription factor 51-like n=1 Tax=Macadamia integrifolia TaxID=60698 RepID=UPI001C4E7C78|nr:MADS-box transcription factor 51-like [Macadamia integrifolia]
MNMERNQERKKGKGRQKIELKMIESKENRHVTFSKRRSGIFKKANEITVMCGAEIAVVVFSPAGQVFSYGSPSVTSVIDRFLNQQNSARDRDGSRSGSGSGSISSSAAAAAATVVDADADAVIHALRMLMDSDENLGGESTINELNREYAEVLKQLENEKQRSSELGQKSFWEERINNMGMFELERLRNNAVKRVGELKAANTVSASSSTSVPMNPLAMVESSANYPNPNFDASSMVPYGRGGGYGFGPRFY